MKKNTTLLAAVGLALLTGACVAGDNGTSTEDVNPELVGYGDLTGLIPSDVPLYEIRVVQQVPRINLRGVEAPRSYELVPVAGTASCYDQESVLECTVGSITFDGAGLTEQAEQAISIREDVFGNDGDAVIAVVTGFFVDKPGDVQGFEVTGALVPANPQAPIVLGGSFADVGTVVGAK